MGDEPGTSEKKDSTTPKSLVYDNKTLYIYCPPELAHDFITFANAEFAGKQFIALKELLRNWRESRQLAYMAADIAALKEEIELLKRQKTEQEAKNVLPTMGGHELERE